MTDPDLSKFFPEAMQVLGSTECKACLVVVVESAGRGNGAAPAFAVPNGADGHPDGRELARLQRLMCSFLRAIANDLEMRAGSGGRPS